MDEMSINWTLVGVYLGAPVKKLFINFVNRGACLTKSPLRKS